MFRLCIHTYIYLCLCAYWTHIQVLLWTDILVGKTIHPYVGQDAASLWVHPPSLPCMWHGGTQGNQMTGDVCKRNETSFLLKPHVKWRGSCWSQLDRVCLCQLVPISRCQIPTICNELLVSHPGAHSLIKTYQRRAGVFSPCSCYSQCLEAPQCLNRLFLLFASVSIVILVFLTGFIC